MCEIFVVFKFRWTCTADIIRIEVLNYLFIFYETYVIFIHVKSAVSGMWRRQTSVMGKKRDTPDSR
jgi:hypothetical protein